MKRIFSENLLVLGPFVKQSETGRIEWEKGSLI